MENVLEKKMTDKLAFNKTVGESYQIRWGVLEEHQLQCLYDFFGKLYLTSHINGCEMFHSSIWSL